MSYDRFLDGEDDFDSYPVESTIERVLLDVAKDFIKLINGSYGGSIDDMIAYYDEYGEDIVGDIAHTAERIIEFGNICNIEVDFDNSTIDEVYHPYWTFMGSRYYEDDVRETWDFDEFADGVLDKIKKLMDD